MSHTMMKEALRLQLRRLWREYLAEAWKVVDELDRLESLDSIERIYPMTFVDAAYRPDMRVMGVEPKVSSADARQAHQESCQKLKGNVMTESSFVPTEERIYPIRAQRSKFQPLSGDGIRSFEDLSTRLDGEIG